MPKISLKGNKMPESPIRKLVPYAEKAKLNGTKVIHLNIGQPDISSPQVSFNSLVEFSRKNNVIEYSHSAGFLEYRIGLVDYYNSCGISLETSNILVTTGGSEALLFALNSCLDYGDEVIIPEPFYANYNGFSISAGVKVKSIQTKIENSFALPSIEDFENLITDRTKAILICNPGNPSGYLYSEDELNRLKELVKKYDLFLFSDEVYREFCYDGSRHQSILNIRGIEENVVVIDSTSKRYSMCGIRIGCVISRNKLLMNTILKFAQARLSPPTLGQVAANAALKTPDSYFINVIDEYQFRRDVLIEGLNKIAGVICPKPKGAFYAIAQLPIDDADKYCQWLLEDFEYNGCTVMLAPAAGFYTNDINGKNQVRIAYVLNVEELRKAIKCLQVSLTQYPGRIQLV
tara:strand:+ start:149 stop:1360 length:1212 start_codon:yes stop_codon:yes gene_type:complete